MNERVKVEIIRLRQQLNSGQRVLDDVFLQSVKRLMNLDANYSKYRNKAISTPEALRWWRKHGSDPIGQASVTASPLRAWREKRPKRKPVEPIQDKVEEMSPEQPPLTSVDESAVAVLLDVTNEKTVELAVHHLNIAIQKRPLTTQHEIVPTLRQILQRFSIFPQQKIQAMNAVEVLSWWQLQGGILVLEKSKPEPAVIPDKVVQEIVEDKYSNDIRFFLSYTTKLREAKRKFDNDTIDSEAYSQDKQFILEHLEKRCLPQSQSQKMIMYAQWQIEGLITLQELQLEKQRKP